MSKEGLRIDINEAWCKGCEICVEVCTFDVLEMRDFVAKVKNLDNCKACMSCELLCPDFAIEIHVPDKKKEKVSAEGD